jgi:protein arginine N-methyltransferase 5
MLTLGAETFCRNAKGYPVLSKAHQAFVSRFMRLRTRPWLLLCDVGPLPAFLEPTTNGAPSAAAPSTSPASFPTPAEAFTNRVMPEKSLKDPTPHLSYLRNFQTKQPLQSPLERFGAGYQDYLQAPLQPLTVNLESITYEVFEKDPIKYDWYEKAIARALHDWIEQCKPTSNADGRVVVAVVGAGRGPLVTRALRAAEDVGVAIDMWALEKNPNAFVLLQRHNEAIWGNQVHLVKSDMRTWKGPLQQPTPSIPSTVSPNAPTSQAQSSFTGDAEIDRDYLAATASAAPKYYTIDILISELLGSFADNELSPECLDGVQHLLNPTHGISIPASYTAHITPIATPKLHADIASQSISNPSAPETPFVVMLHTFDYLSTTVTSDHPVSSEAAADRSNGSNVRHMSLPPQTLQPIVGTAWAFSHPNPAVSGSAPNMNAHNTRHCTLRFPVSHRGVCHGLAGYFETVLYDNVRLSTNPTTMEEMSAGMISWFPIYFPLKASAFHSSQLLRASLLTYIVRHRCMSRIMANWSSTCGARAMTERFGMSGWSNPSLLSLVRVRKRRIWRSAPDESSGSGRASCIPVSKRHA